MGNNRFPVSDEYLTFFERLLRTRVNTHRFGGGRPPRSVRNYLNCVLFVLRTGCQGKAIVATGICPGSTAHVRFQQWVQAGVFETLFHHAAKCYAELIGLDWSFLSLDGATTQAPLGGEENGPQPHRRRKKRDQTQSAGRRSWDSNVGSRGRRQCALHVFGRREPVGIG